MTSSFDELRRLRGDIERKRRLELMVSDLTVQQAELAEKVRHLEAQKRGEEADVERLEGHSLAALFYGLIGKSEEKLDKERREAAEARVRYDAASRELASVEEDLLRRRAELAELEGCEQRFERALDAKAAELKATGGSAADAILRLEEREAACEHQDRELGEAIAAGAEALATADDILSSLGSAGGWATFDLLGGGLLADLGKYAHLDEAQRMIEELQVQLRRFKTELVDVSVGADFQVGIDGFLRFADFFFDGLIADWAVMDRISSSEEQMQNTRDQIQAVLDTLERMRASNSAELASIQSELNELICNS